MQQEISTELDTQNAETSCDDKSTVQQENGETVSDETVSLAEDSNNCFQNNFQNRNKSDLLESEEDMTEDSEVFFEVQELIKKFSSNSNNKITNLTMLITTDEQLLFYTGINFIVLKNLAKTALAIELRDRGADRKSVSYQSIKNSIVLCLCKLKRNYTYQVLSVLFRMSPKNCEDSFYYTISLLSEILRKVIYWPEKEEVLEESIKFVPQCFLNFNDVQFVLHCIEVAIKKPSNCLKCSFCTHSLSKGCSTIKFIIAIVPLGLISFVSKAYGGLAPAQAIIDQSNILKLINLKKDAIMVNSYLAADLQELEKQVKLVKPYNFGSKSELNDDEKKLNTDFETCYSQIENIVKKFSEFNILNGDLTLAMACCIDKITTVIAGLINLQE